MNIERPDELLAYLQQSGHLASTEPVKSETLAGGVSNRTVLVRRDRPPNWVIKQSLPKLRVDVDWYCDPSRIHRESLGLRTLQKLLDHGHVPELLFEDHEHGLFAMTAVAEPHENWKTRLLSGEIEDHLIIHSADILAEMHSRSAARPADCQGEFADQSFFESLRLEPYYRFASEQVPEAKPFLDRLIDATRSQTQALVHGDYSPKNILVRRSQLILLDYEVIHWGDPSFDCGFFLTHLLSKAHYCKEQREQFLSAARSWLSRYLTQTEGHDWAGDLELRVVQQTLGCLLARVRGRSQLEYLSTNQRDRQADAVLAIMTSACNNFAELCDRFSELIG